MGFYSQRGQLNKMKVICTNLDRRGLHWLQIGGSYYVMSIYIEKRGILFRVWSESLEEPAIFDARFFDVVDGRLPSGWTVVLGPGDAMSIEPVSFCRAGFWDRYFDGDKEEIRLFNEEFERVISI